MSETNLSMTEQEIDRIIDNLEAQHENKNENNQKNEWVSCCMTLDREAVKYFTQLFVSLMIISFCIAQLIRLESCEGQQTYIALLMMVIGCWLPQPKFKK
jgi:hypothetical protein